MCTNVLCLVKDSNKKDFKNLDIKQFSLLHKIQLVSSYVNRSIFDVAFFFNFSLMKLTWYSRGLLPTQIEKLFIVKAIEAYGEYLSRPESSC